MTEPKKQKYLIVAVALVSLAGGYFAGREHVKFEMRQAMTEVSNQFKKGMSEIFDGKNTQQDSEKSDAKTLKVSLVSKGTRDLDLGMGVAAITLSIEITNILEKDIRAFDGTLLISDILDNPIKNLNLSYTKPIKANETVTWDGEMSYNQFMNSDRKLHSNGISDLKTAFTLRKVLYADGTKEEF